MTFAGEAETSVDTDRVALSPDAHLYLLDEHGLVFSEPSQEVHLLNTAAAAAWMMIEDGAGHRRVSEAMAGLCQVSPDEATALTATMLDQWRQAGLLAGSERPQTITRSGGITRVDGTPATAFAGPPPAAIAAEPCYRLLSSTARIRYTTAEQERWARPVLAHLEIAPVADVDSTVTVHQGEDGIRLEHNGLETARLPGVEQLAPFLKAELAILAIKAHDYVFSFHAGVVSNGHRCALLPAASGSGKSSTTAALCHAGYGYFTDEMALLCGPDLLVPPFPIGLCVKTTGTDAIAPLFPALPGLAVHQRPDGKRVRYLNADRLGWRPGTPPQPIAQVIFPHYRAGEPTRLAPMNRADGLRRLMTECLSVPRELTPADVAALVEWARALRFHELTQSSLADAVREIGAVFPLQSTA